MQGATDSSLKLPSVLDLAASEALLDAMRQACDAQTATVDASGVDVVTSPCMQVILAALRASPGMRIENPSTAFVEAFADLALDWRQDDQHDHDQEAAQEDGQGAAVAAPINPEDETESAFLAAAQQYADSNDEPADEAGGEMAGQVGPAADVPAATADLAEDDPSVTPDTQTPEASMAKRILTIDDSKTIRDMLNLTLSEAGFEVLQAVDGEDGIDVLEKQNDRVDVVITDINMPKMDGYGVIRHIRGQQRYNGMPVLVLTTESEKEKRTVAREAGATGWMVKPFDPERLIATINKVAP
jgi:two-component system, chemotaxis family, chemotaxis protein CheY